MRTLRGGILLLALVAAAGPALAQDPGVNESDFDTTAPEPDESYLADDAGGDPALAEGDFDTSVPEADESYLATETGPAGGDGDKAASTPGFGAAALALAIVGAALLLRRR